MLKFLVFTLLALSCFTFVHSVEDSSKAKRIIAGTLAVAGQFKFMVGLSIQTPDGGFLCGGFILNEHYIGTAAHCIDGYRNSTFHITTFGDDLDLDADPVAGSTIKAHVQAEHPLFNINNLTNGYDVAILRTMTPLTLGGNLRAIPLATELPAEGDNAFLAGYGTTADGSTGTLYWDTQPVVHADTCSEFFPPGLASNMFVCAGGLEGFGSCQGDSGSALFTTTDINNPIDAKVIGIVSFGKTPCGGPFPVAYINIPGFAGPFFHYSIATASYCSGDCIKTFRKCVGPLRKCRRAKQACIAKCIFI